MLFNANKLKVQLRLSVNRLKMLQSKKASINAQQRREIALLLEKGKEESARIRVEHIIREDYNVEAMEMMEIFCEMLLARFGLIEQMKQCDPSISEAACSIIYAAPRCEAKELLTIKDYLGAKYGKEFVQRASENKDNCVNDRLVQKLKVKVPPAKLVTSYLVEIARNYNVAWTGGEEDFEIDSSLMGDSTLDAEFNLPSPPPTLPSVNQGKGGKGSGGSGGMSQPAAHSKPPPAASSSMPSASSSLLDDMFPSVPTSSKQPHSSVSAPQHHQPADEPEESAGGDDGNLPDFDELTKRFEALKKRQ